MPGFCMGRVATRVRVRVHSRARSPAQQAEKSASFISPEDKTAARLSNELSFNSYLPESQTGNRVMVVVDSSFESNGALEWALSHTVQSQDTLILLHVGKEAKNDGDIDQKGYDLLRSKKNLCQLKRPEVHVEMAIQQGKEKGAIIVKEAKRLKISLLIMGHRKQSLMWRFSMFWTGKKTRSKVVDYCIENSNCMTIAVRRKNRKHGGYLITTKRHKKFWLLA